MSFTSEISFEELFISLFEEATTSMRGFEAKPDKSAQISEYFPRCEAYKDAPNGVELIFQFQLLT